MIYCCDHCHFIFERVGQIDTCPDCGKPSVREADEAERAEFQKNLRDKGDLTANGNRK